VNVRAGRALDLSAAQRKKCSRFATDASGASPYSKGLRVTTENIAKASLACNDAISKEYPLSFRTALCSCIVNSSLKFGSEAERVDGGRCNLVAKYLTNTGQNLTARQFAGLPRKGDSFAKATDAPATYPSRAYAADPPAAANKRPEETETEECDTDCKARKRGYGDAEDMAEDLGIDVDEANDMLEDE
jgi:hypothetical protein